MIVGVYAVAECPIHGRTWATWHPFEGIYVCTYGLPVAGNALLEADRRCQFAGDPRRRFLVLPVQ